MTSTLVEAAGISKSFPGVRALDQVDFELQPGEVHALVGENGAGKSTLVNILTGVLQADAGEVRVGGRLVSFRSPHEARQAGIHVIHQELAFVPHLDVATNLCLGETPVRAGSISRLVGGIVDRAAMLARAERALATVGHPVSPKTMGMQLSVAQAQLVEIARALSSNFRVILFDEPTSSLGPADRDELFGHISRLRDAGIGVLYISHRLEEVLEIADRITVLRDGKRVVTRNITGLTVEQIVTMMTGKAARISAARGRQPGDIVLDVRQLGREPTLRGVSLALRSREIVGLTGLVGAGRTELALCLFGVDPVYSGEILLDGRPIRPTSPREAIELGICYATEDRKGSGVFHERPVRDNIIVGPFGRRQLAATLIRCFFWLRRKAIRSLVATSIDRLGVRPPDPAALVGTMSGGNQQKVILARLIASKARVLILDEPTRGIDVGAKSEIWRLINELAEEGVAVLAISSDIPELIGNVDRILVMRRGVIVGALPGQGVDEAEVMRHAI